MGRFCPLGGKLCMQPAYCQKRKLQEAADFYRCELTGARSSTRKHFHPLALTPLLAPPAPPTNSNCKKSEKLSQQWLPLVSESIVGKPEPEFL